MAGLTFSVGNPWRDAIPGAKPEALQTIIQLMGANVLRQKYNQTHKDVHFWEEVLVEWEREFTRVCGLLKKCLFKFLKVAQISGNMCNIPKHIKKYIICTYLICFPIFDDF